MQYTMVFDDRRLSIKIIKNCTGIFFRDFNKHLACRAVPELLLYFGECHGQKCQDYQLMLLLMLNALQTLPMYLSEKFV